MSERKTNSTTELQHQAAIRAMGNFVTVTSQLTEQQLYYRQLCEEFIDPGLLNQWDQDIAQSISQNLTELAEVWSGLKAAGVRLSVRHPDSDETGVLHGISYSTDDRSYHAIAISADKSHLTWPLRGGSQLRS